MNSKNYFLSCISASALIFSTPIWAETADHQEGLFDDDDGFSFAIRPVIERDFENEGDFSTSQGAGGSFSLENDISIGVDVSLNELVDLGNENFNFTASYRYRSSDVDSISYNRAMSGGSALGAEQLTALNEGVTHKGTVDSHSFGIGAEYQFGAIRESGVKPYLSGGLHYTTTKVKDLVVTAGRHTNTYNDSDGAFGFAIGGGINIDMGENIQGHVGYVYRPHGDYEFQGTSTSGGSSDDITMNVDNYKSHAVMAGITFRF